MTSLQKPHLLPMQAKEASWVFSTNLLYSVETSKKWAVELLSCVLCHERCFGTKKGHALVPFLLHSRLLHFGAWFYWPLDYNLQLKVSKSQKKWSNKKNQIKSFFEHFLEARAKIENNFRLFFRGIENKKKNLLRFIDL